VAILLDDQDVSRRHAVLDRTGGRVVLAELAGRHLRSFTAGLKEAGALAAAGVTVVESIARIAHWLGPVAAGVLALP
jgi:pSer/pThr/pTyr-binding forkhead associated (FHA) protein